MFIKGMLPYAGKPLKWWVQRDFENQGLNLKDNIITL